MAETVIKIENLRKQYTLGAIGGHTLTGDINSWWARVRGKEDPNSKIGEDTSKYGQKFYALNGINLDIKRGEAVGLIGTNGAGKSTLLKILSRVTAPTEGKVCMNGRVTSMLEVGTGFHPELTGRENIYMNGAILGMTRAEIDSKIEEIIDFSECRQFIDTPVKRYSSGMYVKLAFSVAAHLDSDIMIMDEVLAVGDAKFQQKCLGRMDGAARIENKTVLYVSHNMETIRQLCTRCIVLDKGQVIYDGDVEEAIAVYLKTKDYKLQKKYNIEARKRYIPELGQDIRVKEFIFLCDDKPIFENIMRFRIHYTANKSYSSMQLVCNILSYKEEPIGMTVSEIFEIEQGEHVKDYSFDITNLYAGKYLFNFELHYVNEFGTRTEYDYGAKFLFEVRGSDERDGYNLKYRRYVKLNNIIPE